MFLQTVQASQAYEIKIFLRLKQSLLEAEVLTSFVHFSFCCWSFNAFKLYVVNTYLENKIGLILRIIFHKSVVHHFLVNFRTSQTVKKHKFQHRNCKHFLVGFYNLGRLKFPSIDITIQDKQNKQNSICLHAAPVSSCSRHNFSLLHIELH